ncbi:MFS transporter [Paenarthrobacter sp. NPDC058040]|uniref:MFS transporter n=1 Tax=unclassified Paenarthrobacter TaxID=2634190 RepID=UPI0036DA535E
MHGQTPTTQHQKPGAPRPGLPLVIYVLALGTFLMLTTEFVVAGILPEIAADVQVSVAQAGLLITVFAIGMVAAPAMAMLTLRMPRKLTLILALVVFAAGHVMVALGSSFELLLVARFVTALATGAFWSVAAVVATHAAGASMAARGMGLINAGGMLATVIGVPLGALAGQTIGWRGTFWALAVLSIAVIIPIARKVPREAGHPGGGSLRSEFAALGNIRLWLVLTACATTSGGVLAAYTYISPLLTEQAALPATLVPLVLIGFGTGSFVGNLLGGRFGDSHPHLATILAPAGSTVILFLICIVTGQPVLTAVLLLLLGLFGLGANPVLMSFAVRFAGRAPTLGSSLSVSSFNAGTAIGSWVAGLTLASPAGVTGPAMVGTAVVALTLIPVTLLAKAVKNDGGPRRPQAPAPSPEPSSNASALAP